uniref:NADH-ubiquinone oxidoreductase chain 5 n=1 Tax=Prionospio sp. 2 MH-2023 TaxID=3059270 RepID=A0AAU6QH04_9ANNE
MFSRSYPTISAFFLYFFSFSMFPLALFLMKSEKVFIIDWIISSFASPITLTLILDPHGTILSAAVLFISANVMMFAESYMKGDPFMSRFIQLVLLFVASMNLLIFIPNLITLLLGWDGLGLVSFLLVIYYQTPKALAGGMITALTNRIGDVLILISIAWGVNLGYWNFLFPHTNSFSLMISLALMVAAMTKSAQIPFSSWLPAAMAAPTPVSALVHSSTLVTAGVFLLYRFYPSLSTHSMFNTSLLIMATLTCLMAGLSANTECDMKKIIALSTLSQLGVMMVSIGLGAPLLAFFHLITHALFKALLFLCAGTLIHLHHHSQDLRYMGNLNTQMPSISSAMMVSNLALCGTPFLAGFYSKDSILEFAASSPTSMVIILLFFFATGLTVSYTIRFLMTVVWGPMNISPLHPINDMDFFCSFPTFTLASFSIVGGASLNWMMISPIVEPFLPPHLKFLTLFVCFMGLYFGYTSSHRLSSQTSTLYNMMYTNYASCAMWFLTPLSTQKALPVTYWVAHQFSKTLDQGWEEMFGGQGALSTFSNGSTFSVSPSASMVTTHITLSIFIAPLALILMF